MGSVRAVRAIRPEHALAALFAALSTIGPLVPVAAHGLPSDGHAQVYVQVVDGEAPVRGLTLEDFEVRQRGDSVPIVDVIEVGRRQWIFFYDTTFGASLLPEALEVSLDLLGEGALEGDRVGAVVYSEADASPGAQLRALQPTEDLDSVAASLADLRLESRGMESPAEPNQGASASRRRINDLVRALEDAAKILGSGDSNHILVFSEAFDLSVGLGDGLAAARERESAALRSEAAASTRLPRRDSRIRRASKEQVDGGVLESLDNIERAGCAVHAVRLGGNETEPSPRTGAEDDQGPSLFAEATGGETFRSPAELAEALVPLLRRTNAGYRLILQPKKYRGDGRFRNVEVHLLGGPEGAQLIAPAGYYESP